MDSFSDNRKSKIEYPKWGWGFAIVFALGLFGEVALAQQARTMPLIGYLAGAGSSPNQAFMQGMRDIGYVEGKSIAFAYRTTEGRSERYAELAAELVSLKVDIIVADGTGPGLAAKKATSTIPIVLATGADPVGNGLVASLARPGGNITGLSRMSPELAGKRLELLKEVVPRLSRVAVLGSSPLPGNAQALRETELAAGALTVKLQYLDVRGPKDIETAFQAVSKERAEAVLLLQSPVLNSQRTQVVELAVKSRLPAIYYAAEWVEDGGLMTYSVSQTDLFRRAAVFVVKILKGAKPTDLPVEQPTKFELVINLKTAKQIGLTIPPNVLVRADKVIR